MTVQSKRQRTAVASKRAVKGFQNNAERIARKQGIPIERAKAILAKATRRASPAAKKRNPALKKVKVKKS